MDSDDSDEDVFGEKGMLDLLNKPGRPDPSASPPPAASGSPSPEKTRKRSRDRSSSPTANQAKRRRNVRLRSDAGAAAAAAAAADDDCVDLLSSDDEPASARATVTVDESLEDILAALNARGSAPSHCNQHESSTAALVAAQAASSRAATAAAIAAGGDNADAADDDVDPLANIRKYRMEIDQLKVRSAIDDEAEEDAVVPVASTRRFERRRITLSRSPERPETSSSRVDPEQSASDAGAGDRGASGGSAGAEAAAAAAEGGEQDEGPTVDLKFVNCSQPKEPQVRARFPMTSTFREILALLCQQRQAQGLPCDPAAARLEMDGDELGPEDTPEDEGLEDGFQVDAYYS